MPGNSIGPDFFHRRNFEGNTYSPTAAYLLSVLASGAYERRQERYDEMSRLLMVAISNSRSPAIVNFQPAVTLYRGLDLDVFAIEGTTNQWFWYAMNTATYSRRVLIGSSNLYIHSFFAGYYQSVLNWINSRRINGRKFVVCGHSLGGALAVVVGALLRFDTSDCLSVWTYGAPRIIDEFWAKSYQPACWRHEAYADVVPTLPFNNLLYVGQTRWVQSYFAFGFEHPGTQIFLQHLDYNDVDPSRIVRTMAPTARAATRLIARIDKHYAAAYVEQCYKRLEREAQRYVMPIQEAAIENGTSTPITGFLLTRVPSPDVAAYVPAPPPPPNQTDTLARQERSVLEAEIDDDAIRVRLYASISKTTPEVVAADFVEVSFPGYLPQSLPQTMRVIAADSKRSYTDDARFVFELADDLDDELIVRGVYVTRENATGGPTLAGYERFPSPAFLKNKGDRVALRITLEASTVVEPP